MSKNRGKKKLYKETWNLDEQLLKWLNAHFIAYKKCASKNVDLTYHKFEYNGETLTQGEIIDRIIEITNFYIHENDMYELVFDEEKNHKMNTYKNELFDLLKEVFWCMWW